MTHSAAYRIAPEKLFAPSRLERLATGWTAVAALCAAFIATCAVQAHVTSKPAWQSTAPVSAAGVREPLGEPLSLLSNRETAELRVRR